MADLTKNQGQILDWTLLDDTGSDNPFAETGIQTKSDELKVGLNITVAHKDTNDAANAPVTISILARVGTDNEAWRKLFELTAEAGQATGVTLAAASGQGQANPERLEVASTADWDTGEPEWLFLLDSGTLVDSCLCFIEGWIDNDYYINAWDLVRAYDNADILHNKVSQFKITIPEEYQYFNVVFHNSHGTATYAVRVDYASVTEIV